MASSIDNGATTNGVVTSSSEWNPEAALAQVRHEFGEHGGVNQSVEVSTTFTFLDPSSMPKVFSGLLTPKDGCYLYGRSYNPTVQYLGQMLAGLEGTESAYCTSSGMAAVTGTILGLCDSGDHIVASRAIYGGTHALFTEFLPLKCNIHTTFVNIHGDTGLEEVERAIGPRTKLVYCETLSNPTLRVADVGALSRICRSRGIKLVVDNTFTPVIMSPARLGADVVIHSLTKFVSGASDIIAGAICGSAEFILSLFDLHRGALMLMGPTMDPHVASQLEMRLPHLALRMREHSQRAMGCAQLLQGLEARLFPRRADEPSQVSYPGLPSHPDHLLFKRQMNQGYGYGGMLNVSMPSLGAANLLMSRLQHKHAFGLIAVSLGYCETLMSASGSSTSSEMSEAEKLKAGIDPGLVRFSIGLTGTLDARLAQLREAYEFTAAKVREGEVPAGDGEEKKEMQGKQEGTGVPPPGTKLVDEVSM